MTTEINQEISIEGMFDVLRALKLEKKHAAARATTIPDAENAQYEFAALDLAIRTLAAQFPTEANS